MSNSAVTKSDNELIERFKRGEQWAFDELVDRHSGKAYQIAFGVLGNKEDAEEVAQDVFVRVHRSLEKFRGDSEFTTWMYRIAVNLARNKYRWNKTRGSQKNVSLDAPVDGHEGTEKGLTIPDRRIEPDKEASVNELEKQVMDELQKLPPLYREALVMRNVDQMSYEQIAGMLGCKLGTIKSRIARARDELRRRLKL